MEMTRVAVTVETQAKSGGGGGENGPSGSNKKGGRWWWPGAELVQRELTGLGRRGGGCAMCFNEGLQLLLAGCRYNAALALFDKASRCCTKVGCDWWCASSNNYSWRSNSSSSKKLVATTNDAAVGRRHVVGSGWSRRRAAALLASNRGNATKLVTAKTVEVNDDKETGNQHGRKGGRARSLVHMRTLATFLQNALFSLAHSAWPESGNCCCVGPTATEEAVRLATEAAEQAEGGGGGKRGGGAVLCWKWW